VQKFSI
jgi:TolB protein